MSKTRMGKRVASLLLSLVMMLSLLPTTVYAEGADGAATNDAVVEETIAPVNAEGVDAVAQEAESSGDEEPSEADNVTSSAVAKIGDKEYATLEEAIEAAQDGETITLVANVEVADLTLDQTVTIKSEGETQYEIKGLKAIAGTGVTLDNVYLNLTQTLEIGGTYTTLTNCTIRAKDVGYWDIVDGKTAGFTGGKAWSEDNAESYLTRVTGENVTLTDCLFDGTDKDNDSFPNMCLAPVSGTDVTMTRCTFNEGFGACYYSTPRGTWTLDGCKFTKIYCYNIQAGDTTANIVVKNCDLAGWTSFGSTMESVSFENCDFAASSGYATVRAYKDATFTDCTFTEDYKANLYVEDNTAVELNGCKVVDTNSNESTTVGLTDIVNTQGMNTNLAAIDATKDASGKYTGGTFVGAETAIKNVIAEDSNYDAATGAVMPATTNAVAKIGDKEYATLTDAIAAAQDGATVTLLADVEQNSCLEIDKNITLDLAGKKIYNTEDIWGDNANAILSIRNGAKVTITGNGTIAAKENDCYTFNVVDGDLTIENGEFIGNVSVVQVQMGSLEIKGGKFSLAQKWDGKSTYLINCIDENFTAGTAKVAISGGTFEDFDPNVSPEQKVDGKAPSFAAPGVGITKNADGTFTATPNMVAQILDKDGNSVKAYDDLAKAIAAAEAGDTVTLLADATEDVTINKSITLDLGGKTLTNTGAGKATISVTTGTVTVKGGSVVGGSSYYNIEVTKGSNANLTLEDVTATAGNTGSSMIDNWGTLTIESGTYTGGMNTVKSEEGSTLTINGGKFTCDFGKKWSYTAVILVYGTTTINGGEFIQKTTNTSSYAKVVMTGKVDGYEAFTKVTGGTFTNEKLSGIFYGLGAATSANFKVSGGTFNKSISEGYCADGFIPTKNADGTYGVKEGQYVAKVGSTKYETLADAIRLAANGKTVTLLADCESDRINLEKKSITVDLNGKTLTSTADYGVMFCAKNGNTITINGTTEGSKLVGTLMVTSGTDGHIVIDGGTYENDKYCPIYINGAVSTDDSTLTVTNATIKALAGNSDQDNGVGVYLAGYSTSTFTNTTITAPVTGLEIRAGRLTLTDCNVTGGNGAVAAKADGSGSTVANAAVAISQHTTKKNIDVTINGGTYTATAAVYQTDVQKTGSENVKASIESGTFNGTVSAETDNTVAVSGGSFSSAVPENCCAAGFIPTKNEDGSYGVKVGTYVAEYKGTKYETLQAAIDAAARNATVKLLADTRENVTISTPYLTLDLNGFTLNGSTGERKPALTVTARVTVKDSSAAQTGTIMREDTVGNSGVSSHYVIDVQGAGWLTFESGNVKNDIGAGGTNGASLVRVGSDSVAKYPGLNIKGGTFTQDNFIVIKVERGDLFLNGGSLNSANSYAVQTWHRATIKGGTVNGAVSSWTYDGGPGAETTISGGTVNGNVEAISYDGKAGKPALVSISGGTVNGTLIAGIYNSGTEPTKDMATIEITGGTFSSDPTKYVIEDSAITANADGTFGVAKAYLATVGDTSYYTMDEAFKAQTASRQPIVLLRDYTTGSTFNSGTVARVVDLGSHTWTCTGTDANSAAFEINNPNASLTVKNGKIVSSQLVGLIPSASGGTITYDNSSLTFENVEMSTTATSGIETNGNNTNDTVTLKNSTLNVPNGFGIYFPSSGTLTIDNSTITAKTMGVQVCSGSLSINEGSEITVTGDAVPKTENDGAIQDGAAISIVNRTGYKGLGDVTVTGGTFTAKDGNDAIKAYKWENQTESTFDNSNNVVAVSGGTFSSAVPEGLCKAGYIPVANDNGTHTVKEGEFTVQVTSRTVSSDTPVANVSGGGNDITYADGTTVTAASLSGYKFVGWFVDEYTDKSKAVSPDLSFKFQPTADCTLIAVYEPISGGTFTLKVDASKFKVNGGATNTSKFSEKLAANSLVTIKFTGDNFLYWVNGSGKVVSTLKEYTFTLVSATVLSAVYTNSEADEAQVIFLTANPDDPNSAPQIVSSRAYAKDTTTISFPAPPVRIGKSFTGWSMTQEQIIAAIPGANADRGGKILVYAMYEDQKLPCTVTVFYGDKQEEIPATIGTRVELTAPQQVDGKEFSCWKDSEGKVLGTTSNLYVTPVGDMTVYAVYGETVEQLPTISMLKPVASVANEKYVVTFSAVRSIPNGYTIEELGILYSMDSNYGNPDAEEYMVLGSDGEVPAGVYRARATQTTPLGTVRCNITTGFADRTFYARGYMILKDSEGNVTPYYSEIASGSYNSLTNGGN